ncbi:RidA family protein [Pseudonocardia kujensis]|uniref:Rid family hydrolase n=1 Tax=Pseudonocardia kujensis TaxID=1128675 RepID=UPI001E36BFB2|nr:Rid family hydrolase [Pseudonocardia kujensis]MCE0764930.1 RidA family protein [Pseudonocardia kujensis]
MIKYLAEADHAAAPAASYSLAVDLGTAVVTAGQIGRSATTGELADGLEAQITTAIENLAAVLGAAGSDLAHVVKTTCLLADIADFDRFDAIYRRHFTAPYPARTTYAVSFPPGLRFEIEAVAMPSEIAAAADPEGGRA